MFVEKPRDAFIARVVTCYSNSRASCRGWNCWNGRML